MNSYYSLSACHIPVTRLVSQQAYCQCYFPPFYRWGNWDVEVLKVTCLRSPSCKGWCWDSDQVLTPALCWSGIAKTGGHFLCTPSLAEECRESSCCWQNHSQLLQRQWSWWDSVWKLQWLSNGNTSGKILATGIPIELHPPRDGGDGAVCLTLRKARRQSFLALLH